ncbi:MAG: hypothetical protein EXR76_07415 [Myxococcales bacterium]|nr:hypothetical protein [Myxococcales bacterium]
MEQRPKSPVGSERRRNRFFVTQNTEYHLQGRDCVAVRDLWTGRWLAEHPALGRKLFGAVLPTGNGLEPLTEPKNGCLLWFENGDNDILTSRISAMGRPTKASTRHYAEVRHAA